MPVKKKSAKTVRAAARHKYDSACLESFLEGFLRRNPNEPEFQQAVREVALDVFPVISGSSEFAEGRVLERLTLPDRVIILRVCWEDDKGNLRVNNGYRVQFSNSVGPYKGGLRFHPSVNLSIVKFLAFEQTFKNSLTLLPLGSGKGGSDFNPRNKSEREIERFCKSFMTELYRFIGPDVDVPAGDIGVGSREIGYLFGQYKKLTGKFSSGTITGKGLDYGGSQIRTEATGYGTVYFASKMLEQHGMDLEGLRCCLSGSGNVALHCAEKLIERGAKVLTLSDSGGFIHEQAGFTAQNLDFVKNLKLVKRARISEYLKRHRKASYHEGQRPWGVPCDAAFPCATQNEINGADAKTLLKNGCKIVIEGANMPSTLEAIGLFRSRILFGPAKAANAGGVAVSGLEMSQNTIRYSWSRQELDQRLHDIMNSIHAQCVEHGLEGKKVDYLRGANVAGFLRVARAMLAQGY